MVSRRAALAIGGLIAACAITIPGAGAAVPGTRLTIVEAPPGTPTWLIKTALRQASFFGDPHPSSITVSLGTNYKLVIGGDFVCPCSHPPGSDPPNGDVAVIVFDGHSKRVKSFGMSWKRLVDAANAYGRGRIEIARQSNRLFSIFPTRIKTQPCSIIQADPSQPKLAATCSTQLRKFRDGRARITFEQIWFSGAPLTHTWIVVVSAEGTAGRATSKGDPAPQLAPGEKTN